MNWTLMWRRSLRKYSESLWMVALSRSSRVNLEASVSPCSSGVSSISVVACCHLVMVKVRDVKRQSSKPREEKCVSANVRRPRVSTASRS